MSAGCLSQSLGGELVKMLIIIVVIIFNLSEIRKEFVCTIMHIKHMRTLILLSFPHECLLLDLGVCQHTTAAAVPRTSTEKQSAGSDDEPLLVDIDCSGSSSLTLPFLPPFLLLSNSSHFLYPPGSWESRQIWIWSLLL